MKITELNIAEFGCLKNRKIELDGRMNILYGENESGKSTLLLFIKFMLYGLGRRSAGNTERERSISWSGHTAAGSMTFTHGGSSYRIERRFTEATRGGNETLSIICLDDGSQVVTEKSAGEYFLGVPKEVFESSACVGQMRSTEINGEKTASSVQNMLSSADENVDTSKILKNLDSVRVGYRHKNKTGGSLYETEQEIAALRQRLDKAREANLSLEGQTQRLKSAQSDYETVKRDFEAKDAMLSELNKITVLQRFAKYHRLQEEYDGLLQKKQELIEKNLRTELIPDRGHVAELKVSARNMAEAQARLDEKIGQSEKRIRDYDGELAALGERLEQNGGKDAVALSVGNKQKRLKTLTATVLGLWLASAVFIAAATFFMLQGIYLAALGFAAPIAAVVVTVVNSKRKRAIKSEIQGVLEEYGATADLLYERLELCTKHLALMRAFKTNDARLEAELVQARAALERVEAELSRLLAKTLVDAEPTQECAQAEIERLEGFVSRYETLERETDALKRLVDAERDALRHYDEEQLKREVSTDIEQVTPAVIAGAERERTFLLRKKESLEQKIFALNDYLVQLRANAQDPLPIADKLSELEAKYRKDCEFYEALALAMETLEKAGETMSGNVMPAVASRAGEIMAKISGDRYTVLRATSGFALSLDSDGFGVKSDFLSAGTKDAAYLSLRIALFLRIFGTELPPLVLDEALCQFDDTRAERMLTTLGELAGEGVQCLLFTSHRREIEICERVGIEQKTVFL